MQNLKHLLMGISSLLILSTTIAAQSVNSSKPHVGVDLRVELFAIIFRLAGNPEYNQGKLQNYISDIDRYFGPYREHPAIEHARQLREKMGVGFDIVMFLAIHMTDPYELRERVPFDAPGGILEQKGIPKPQAKQFAAELRSFLEDVRRFTVEAKVREFFDAHKAFYDSAGLGLRQIVENNVDFGWFDRFYGKPPAADFLIVPLLANSETNFGPRLLGPDVRTELYAILTTSRADAKGIPIFDKGKVSTLVHEFSHSYINPLVTASAERFEPSAKRIFKQVEDAMTDQGNGEWQIMMFESLVRAATIRYMLAHEGKKAAQSEIKEQQAKGYLFMPEIVNLMGEYEINRKKYPTLESFMPRIIALFDSLALRIEAMKLSYDAQRPKVLSVSVKNGDNAVDPALTEIVVQFDKPMRRTSPVLSFDIHPVRGRRERFPTITAQEFDKKNTSFRLTIRLEPDRNYELVLNRPSGGAFQSKEGIALSPYTIQFKTRKVE